jgi:peptide/nickel transport system substrate-binding protein
LPADPVVLVPYSEIGEYGGTVTIPALEPKSWWPASQGTTEYFFTRDMRYPDVLLPSIASGYSFSSDYKSLTISLRKGLKWSDGAPFTADDIIFWWEVMNTKDLHPTLPAEWTPGGTPM